jgi:UDP:flavonoid glycosyltransferase YjiC (YdhE family)
VRAKLEWRTVEVVRALFTTIPGYGHFSPLVPLARAAQAAGHTVAVATAESFRPVVERAGLEILPAGVDDATARAGAEAANPADFFVEYFIGQYATALAGDFEAIAAWRPDIVVREEGEYAGPLLAARLRVPWVDHGWGPMRPPALVAHTARALAPMWNAHGLTVDDRGGAFRWLYVDPCPPSLQFAHARDVPVRCPINPIMPSAANGDGGPAWLDELDGRCAIYVTLGTVPLFADDTDFFVLAIEAARDRDLHVIVTVGPRGDPAALGEQPPNVHIERFVSQALVLPHCVAAITNGGSGSTLGALAAGVPVLAVADARSPSQARNGDAIAAAGAGRALRRGQASAKRIRHEITTLITNGTHHEAASRIAHEIAAMPDPADVVTIIEQVAEHHQPSA